MNLAMYILAFLGSIAAYCILVLFLSAIVSMIVKHESDVDILTDLSFVQFVIVMIVLAIYFANMSMGTT